jgi:hypothetical protein
MKEDVTPINARPKRRQPEAFEDASLALREHLLWPVEDRLLGLSDRGRAAVAGGAVVVALGLGIGAFALSSGGSEPTATNPVAAVSERTPHPAPVSPAPEAQPEPTLHGAAPVFKPADSAEKAGASQGAEAADTPATAAGHTGDPATDTITSSPTTSAAAATTSKARPATDLPDGPPAGPAAIAVARKFADAFVVYETGGNEDSVRKAFGATATPELTKALMRRPPHQPAGVEVPQAKVLNIVPAPSHGTIYPLSVSLLRVGATSELRLEMEELKNQGWRVTNVLG